MLICKSADISNQRTKASRTGILIAFFTHRMNGTSNVREDRNPFAKVAATICLAAPLCAIGLAIFFEKVSKSLAGEIPGQTLRLAVLVLAAVSCMLMLTGLIMGILALILMKPGHRAPVVCQTLIGMAILAFLVAVAVPNFVRARNAAIAKNKAYDDLAAASADLREKQAASLKGHQLTTPSPDQFQQKLSEAVAKSSGSEAALLKASQDYAARIIALQKSYQEAAKEMSAASVLSTSNLFDRSAIQQRRALVQNFLKCNDEMKTFLDNDSSFLREEFNRMNVPAAEQERALKGFEQVSGSRPKVIHEIREDDDRMGQAMLGILDLLDNEWDHWKYNEATGRVRFESQADLQQYNSFLRQISQARADQTASQNRLASLMQSSPKPQP